MTPPIRVGVTVPLPGPLHSHRDKLAELADLGYSDIWSTEGDGVDAFTPLTLAAAWEPRLRLGAADVAAFTRGPACLAQSIASLADAAPGRVAVAIGSGAKQAVESWNGIEFEQPDRKVRDIVRFLRDALGGSNVARAYDTFTIDGFRLRVRPEREPTLLVTAAGEPSASLAGSEADGAVMSWVSAADAGRVAAAVGAASAGASREIVCRISVCPSQNAAVVRRAARVTIAATLADPTVADFHEWLGRGPALRGMRDAWAAGDRRTAVAAIPDAVVDDLVVHGSPASCRAGIQA